jgi:hypothetical protein
VNDLKTAILMFLDAIILTSSINKLKVLGKSVPFLILIPSLDLAGTFGDILSDNTHKMALNPPLAPCAEPRLDSCSLQLFFTLPTLITRNDGCRNSSDGAQSHHDIVD